LSLRSTKAKRMNLFFPVRSSPRLRVCTSIGFCLLGLILLSPSELVKTRVCGRLGLVLVSALFSILFSFLIKFRYLCLASWAPSLFPPAESPYAILHNLSFYSSFAHWVYFFTVFVFVLSSQSVCVKSINQVVYIITRG